MNRTVSRFGAACCLCLAAATSVGAQQEALPQDIFGQVAIGLNTRISSQFGRDLSGSIEGMVGTHRAFRSWYRPSAISGGVTRLFAKQCKAQFVGDCLNAVESIPWLAVITGVSHRGSLGTLRLMGGLGGAYARGDFGSSPSVVPVFESRIDYLVFPKSRVGATVFLRNLTVAGRTATQANGIALGFGAAFR